MITRLVGTRHEIGRGGDEVVHDDDAVRYADGRGVTRDGARGANGRVRSGRQLAGLQVIGELRLVHLHVAACHGEHERLLAADVGAEEDGLRRPRLRHVEEGGHIRDRLAVRGLDLLEREGVFLRRRGLSEGRDLTVRRVVALRARDDRVLADVDERHELVRLRSAHHARVGRDGDGRQSTAVEGPEVRAIDIRIVPIQIGLVHVEGIGVLHRELANANEPGAGARLVAELRLDLIEHEGQLAIGLDLMPREVRHDLFVRHTQHHGASRAIVEAGHLGSDVLIATRLLPDLRRLHDGHEDLLPVDRVHLLADDRRDLVERALRERKIGVDSRGQWLNVATSKEVLVTLGRSLGRTLPIGLSKELTHAHEAKSFRMNRFQKRVRP